MHARGNEVLGYELDHPRVRPHLGIQPSTTASHRGGTKIEKCRFLLGSGLPKNAVHVVIELDFH